MQPCSICLTNSARTTESSIEKENESQPLSHSRQKKNSKCVILAADLELVQIKESNYLIKTKQDVHL